METFYIKLISELYIFKENGLIEKANYEFLLVKTPKIFNLRLNRVIPLRIIYPNALHNGSCID